MKWYLKEVGFGKVKFYKIESCANSRTKDIDDAVGDKFFNARKGAVEYREELKK